MSDINQEQMRAWFTKHRTAVLVGCGVAALLVVAGSGNEGNSVAQPQQPCTPGQQGCTPQPNDQSGGGSPGYGGNPSYGGNPGSSGGSGGGGTDMDEWRRREAASDEAQRERIRTIREEEKCRRSDGTEDVVSIHTGC